MTFEKREVRKRITKAEYEKAVSSMNFIEKAFSDYRKALDWNKLPNGILSQLDWYNTEHPEEDYCYFKVTGYEDVILCSEKELEYINLLKS